MEASLRECTGFDVSVSLQVAQASDAEKTAYSYCFLPQMLGLESFLPESFVEQFKVDDSRRGERPCLLTGRSTTASDGIQESRGAWTPVGAIKAWPLAQCPVFRLFRLALQPESPRVTRWKTKQSGCTHCCNAGCRCDRRVGSFFGRACVLRSPHITA